ncbi:MAG: ABC transporter permease [Candidatus Omnitrophica bacterium]|nr:ABC transporter permease [Candidatus Omnitrophota bacterium]MDD5352348.1 ABC transporter permease [Candidatus Omnitrophota bacterium]MDD5549946.1 ABC transporter permease [Candidatus Omnitrophota bacterium]
MSALDNKTLFWGLFFVILLSLIAVFAQFISPYAYDTIDADNILQPPSAGHIFGTDQLGRDVLSRMIYGTRISLSVGFIAVGIATFIGIILGSMAGFYGGFIDRAITIFIDIMLCFPVFFLILAIVALLEPNIYNIMIVIGLTSWMGQARLIRAEILSLKERDFILAEKVLGASNQRIIFFHLLPNAVGPVIVSAILGIAGAILVESGLSFLGIGIQPPTPSWGNILSEAKSTLGIAWWLSVFPGLAIFITIISYNLVGEGLKKYLR